MVDETLLTETELATLTKKSVHTLRGQRMRGNGIPFLKLGANVRYRMADVQRYFDEHTRQSTNEIA